MGRIIGAHSDGDGMVHDERNQAKDSIRRVVETLQHSIRSCR
jgi:hypothetical protein